MICIRSIVGEVVPGAWTSVNRRASGNWRQRISRHFSPPRMPVSQSWTRAIFMAVAFRRRDSAGLYLVLGGTSLSVVKGVVLQCFHAPRPSGRATHGGSAPEGIVRIIATAAAGKKARRRRELP